MDLTDTALRFLRVYGPLALALFAFLESSMLFPFLPSEVVVPAAAALIITDPLSFGTFVLAASVGGTVGALLPFYVFRDSRVGETGWLQRYLRVSEDQVERGRAWFRRWGQSSVLWGRFLPGLRSVVSIPAGITRMDSPRFGAYTAAGTAGFYTAAGAVVYYGRQRSLFEALVAAVTDRPVVAAVAGLALLGAGLLVGRWSRKQDLTA